MKKRLNQKQSSTLLTIFITAAITALATSLVTNWLPNFVAGAYTRLTQESQVTVEVKHNGLPIRGVMFTVRKPPRTEEILASGITDQYGIATLSSGIDVGVSILIQATLCEPSDMIYSNLLKLDHLPYDLHLNVDKDFVMPETPVCSSPTPIPATVNIESVKVTTGKTYIVGKLEEGSTVYADRTYQYTGIPPVLKGKSYLITANDDKFGGKDFLYSLEFDISKDAIVYIAHSDDYVDKPSWLNNFQDTGLDLVFSVNGQEVTLSLYKKLFPAGRIMLGGNVNSTETENHAMYTVIVSDN